MHPHDDFLAEHRTLTRRFFAQAGLGGLAATWLAMKTARADLAAPELAEPLAKLEPYFTAQDKFDDVSRGKPIPHELPDERKKEVGLTRDTWQLEVISDPDHPVKLRKQFTKEKKTAFDFAALMKLAETHAVRFPKVMTCLNIGCPLGMGIWEGVPLRELIWMTGPREDLRRVFYYGYHNDDPEQMFKSSLPIDRVFEDPFDLPPVILCYKLNGEWLTPARGGPVRIVVPEGYGFKSIKWLSHVVLTHLPHANDTYAEQDNDVDSQLKSFSATLLVPKQVAAGQKIPLTGYAQVGVGGLSKVQVWIAPQGTEAASGDPYFATAPWQDAEIISPPDRWTNLPDEKIPGGTLGYDLATLRPRSWPMRLCKAHWATVHPGLPAGKYTLRSRAVDAAGHGQPMPRPLRKSGHAAIEEVKITVT